MKPNTSKWSKASKDLWLRVGAGRRRLMTEGGTGRRGGTGRLSGQRFEEAEAADRESWTGRPW